MKNSNHSEQPAGKRSRRLRAAALRMARRCRHVIQGCLREEEWRDADAEFYAIIVEELHRLVQHAPRDASAGRRNEF